MKKIFSLIMILFVLTFNINAQYQSGDFDGIIVEATYTNFDGVSLYGGSVGECNGIFAGISSGSGNNVENYDRVTRMIVGYNHEFKPGFILGVGWSTYLIELEEITMTPKLHVEKDTQCLMTFPISISFYKNWYGIKFSTDILSGNKPIQSLSLLLML